MQYQQPQSFFPFMAVSLMAKGIIIEDKGYPLFLYGITKIMVI